MPPATTVRSSAKSCGSSTLKPLMSARLSELAVVRKPRSVSVPVAFTSANTPSAGRYNVEIVATYVDGTRRWPDNASAVQLDIKVEGAQ